MIKPVTRTIQNPHGMSWYVVWSGITPDDECAPVQMPQAVTRTVHAFGVFDSAVVRIVGSNAPPNEAGPDAPEGMPVAPLHDLQGAQIVMKDESIAAVLEPTNWIAPAVTGGGRHQSLTIAMLFRSPT